MNNTKGIIYFLRHEWFHTCIVLGGVFLVGFYIYQVSTESHVETERAESEVAYAGLPPTMTRELDRLRETARHWLSLGPDEPLAAISKNQKTFFALAAIGLLFLFLSAVCFMGVALLLWFLLQLYKGRTVITPSYSEKPQWGIWEFVVACSVIVELLACFAFVMAQMEQVLPVFKQGAARMVFVVLPAESLACVYAVRLLWRRYKHRLDAVGLTTKAFGRNVLLGLFGYAAMYPLFLLAVLLSISIARLLGRPFLPNRAVGFIAESNSTVMVLLAAAAGAFVLPVIEEFLFRGLLYGALRKRLSAAVSIFLSAAVFAGFHFNPYQFLPIFVIGVTLAYLYEKTRSLVTSSVVHIIHNSVTMLFLLILRFTA